MSLNGQCTAYIIYIATAYGSSVNLSSERCQVMLLKHTYCMDWICAN